MLNERNTLLEDDGIEEEILVEEECSVAQAVWGDIQGNIENQTDLQNALDSKQDSLTEAQLNAVNSGITAEKVTTYDGYADQIASKADQSALNAESTARGEADTALGTRIDNEALARQSADNGLQTQIDAITSKSDVVDVVANYAALQAYDTSTLGNNDVVKVLDDETHEDALTYYRWSTTTQTWSYIGQEAPYYSKGQMDVMLQGKQDTLTAGANIQIENGTISSTDTTYTAGNGLNLNGTEFSADTDVLATKSDLENYYTKPETDNLLAPKLEAEVVAELPTTGEEGKLYLTPKAHTTQTATGNPITATVTEETGKIESFQLDGDTFQQSYEGHNILPNNLQSQTINGVTFTRNDDGSISIRGTATARTEPRIWQSGDGGSLVFENRQTYFNTTNRVLYYYAGGYYTLLANASVTMPETRACDYVYFRIENGETIDTTIYPQIIEGSTATAYEPYVGGAPSPNPDYPQPIQTVTGTQTININGTDYPLDLGDIELCKLDPYQDYIYKDGENWKLHKDIGKQILQSSGWAFRTDSVVTDGSVFRYSRYIAGELITKGQGLSSHFRVIPSQTNIINTIRFINTNEYGFNVSIANSVLGIESGDSGQTKANKFMDWLSNNSVSVYYALITPTDTTITDQTLIAQLEAIRTASLQNGANTITNTATGSNLAGDMEIGYYGYNPRNRYDKWLWLDINNEYEQIGS